MPRFPGRLGLQNGANMASKSRPKTGQNRIIFWFVLEALLEPSWSPLGALLEPSWPPKSSQHGPPKPPKNGPETCHFEVSNRLPLGSLQKAPRGLQKASRKPPETSKKLPKSFQKASTKPFENLQEASESTSKPLAGFQRTLLEMKLQLGPDSSQINNFCY